MEREKKGEIASRVEDEEGKMEKEGMEGRMEGGKKKRSRESPK